MSVFLQIISVCATLAALCMVASPVITVKSMRAAKSVGSMTITFFCAQFLNCNVWSMYGVQTLALPVIICNTFGSAVAAYCILTFLTVARMEEKAGHVLKSTSYGASLKTATLTIFLIALLLLLFLYLMNFSSSDFAAQLNGILGGCCSVFMLSSPLGMAKAIIHERNAEPLQPATVMFATLNSVLWMLYGLLSLDMYITIPNVLCTLACIFQIFLLVRYGRHPAEHVEITETIAPVPLD
ncbi:Sugar efflux transporter for intercellular exchange [Leishmania donovani]|uniref:Sugar efflux transporter for intercellular exchange family protein n=1 Tax=Leishmania donovani TaxID=5661 RepID=A0A3Q8IJU9_LEIDO|nr:hypothetical protein, conserved [Leishmania donovani]AYU83866.1 Sugar efflux transporter for intercellular exchange, putative [Leishmania donovani]TPP41959.1 Sugar efflux transporter for intercellular exchange family protein [Leishmania donovani]TPP48616.1 Sugar efflux transporter for intercellular exchange family protein [Leishmania donovani]CAJ1993884.1 Sugar efflux transporter for intercellular exchange [Leishmania donovani]CBZ38947.1 hypothetical protein, conserved [Leishmania donovani]